MRLAFSGDVSNGYNLSVLQGVKEWVRENANTQLLEWSGSQQVPLRAIAYLHPDGLLLGPGALQDLPEEANRVPVAGFTNWGDPLRFPVVVNDDGAVGRLAAEALLEADYDTVIVLESGAHTAHRRIEGFATALRKAGRTFTTIALDVRRPRGGESFAEVLEAHEIFLCEAFQKLPANTGLFCPLSAQVAKLLSLLGEHTPHKIPEGIGLVVGDLPNLDATDARLAHVVLDGREIARRACGLLQEAVITGQRPEPRRIEIAPMRVEWGQSLRPRAGAAMLAAMTAYCAPRLRERIRIRDLALALGMSRRTLEVKLAEQGLPPPFEHLTRLRLREAERLLLETDLSIERIAEACGFTEMRSLSRRFRARYGFPPSHLRRANGPG